MHQQTLPNNSNSYPPDFIDLTTIDFGYDNPSVSESRFRFYYLPLLLSNKEQFITEWLNLSVNPTVSVDIREDKPPHNVIETVPPLTGNVNLDPRIFTRFISRQMALIESNNPVKLMQAKNEFEQIVNTFVKPDESSVDQKRLTWYRILARYLEINPDYQHLVNNTNDNMTLEDW